MPKNCASKSMAADSSFMAIVSRAGLSTKMGTAREAADIVRKHAARAVADLIDLFMKRSKHGELAVSEHATALETLRPLGLEAVRIIFGRAAEAGLRKLVASGALTSIPRTTRRRRR